MPLLDCYISIPLSSSLGRLSYFTASVGMDPEKQDDPRVKETDSDDIDIVGAESSANGLIPDGGLVAWVQVLMGI